MRGRTFLTAIGVAIVLLCATAAAASAATYNVNVMTDTVSSGTGACTTGGSPCSLRQALNAVNAGSGGDIVVVPPGTYPINAGFGALQLTKSAAIIGGGASLTVLDGGGATEIINITGSPVAISGLTLSHGAASNRGGAIRNHGTLTLSSDVLTQNASGGAGGAIENQGTLTVQGSTLSGNSASAYGGAINNEGVIGAQALTISDSTFIGNTAGSGGGGAISVSISGGNPSVSIGASLFSGNSATSGGGAGAIDLSTPSGPASAQISDSTFTGNQAAGNGGAINDGRTGTTLTNDTLAGNSAGASGGNIDDSAGNPVPALLNTIVAGGTASSGGNCDTAVTSAGHNLEDANTCGLTGTGDQINTNPQLGPLQSNGGPTQTRALLPGSPAIDRGSNSGCPAADQRGVTRPQGAACDIGAYEAAPPNASIGAATSVGPGNATINATVSNPDAVPATVTFQWGTTTAYGSNVVESDNAFAGPGSFSASLSSLTPNTTYHYRVVVTNPDGTFTSADQTFTTPLPPNQFSFKGRSVSRNGTITVNLGAPWPGVFKGNGTFKAKVGKHSKTFTYGAGQITAHALGTVTLKIKLSSKARKELKKIGKATVTVVVTFTPNGGRRFQRTFKLVIKVNPKGRFS